MSKGSSKFIQLEWECPGCGNVRDATRATLGLSKAA